MIRVAAEQFTTDSATYIERAAGGEEIWIERDGRLVAKLVAAGPADERQDDVVPAEDPEALDLVRQFRQARKGVTLGGLDWKELRDEGRR